MTKLEQLIKELCPNGVEYKKLGEVATISRGGSFQKKDFCEDGVPCIHYGQIYTRYGLFADKTLTFISEDAAKKQKYAVKNDIVMAVTSENIDDVCKCVAWLGDDEIALSGHTAIIHHTLNPKYLCYYFHTAMFYAQKKKLAHGTKVIEVTPDKLADITIPVPPLEVQAEIVNILDEYSASGTTLQQELEKELTARKKQYEYYRDLLLDFGVHGGASECEWRTLGDVAEVTDYVANGSFASLRENVTYKRNPDFAALIRTVDFSNGFDRDQMIYIDENAYKFLEKSRLFGGEIIINNIGAGVGNSFLCPMLDIKMSLAPNAVMLKTNNNKFYFYWLNSKYGKNALSKIISKSAMPKFNKTGLRGVMIPVPPIDEQERIVRILDRFDKLCNDISEGLPAEIEARRKQYEYYRDKLLTFKEKKEA
ncbi:restriction endonuclease subunit S [Ruminococcus sp. HUN007]|uniref:restriction endonuclease subunit S n=1 Tax=Ruminococcus sp. HUN007 TaxID=1514668 RepID=UPI0009DF2BDA|nr:restriction endonuclease subunit S [Ruminococcus sp. HUN007]